MLSTTLLTSDQIFVHLQFWYIKRLNVLVAFFLFIHVSIIECLPYVLDLSFPTYFLCTFCFRSAMWLSVLSQAQIFYNYKE